MIPLLVMACSSPTVTTTTITTSEEVKYTDLVPDTILVDFKDDVSDSDIKELGDLIGTSFSEDNPTAHKFRFETANVDSAKETSVLAALRADSRVEHAEPMVRYHASFVPNDPMYEKDQWHMKRVGAETSWGMSCGMGVTVAVVDTGVACFDAKGFKRLDDLAGTKCEGGYDFVNDKEMAADDQSHGSHVAGTIAQTTNNGVGGAGLAPCVTIMPVKVLSGSGSGTNEGVAEGIRFAADHGAQVINLSLGGGPSEVVKDAVDYAYDKGVTVIAAAGNSSGAVGFPAAYPHAVAISATDQRDNLASFSCFGPQIALAAPGVDVLQQTICRNGDPLCHTYAKYSGTSMATPHVAGGAALVVASGVTNPDAVKAVLQNSADSQDNKNKFGAGILRADSAVRGTILSHFITRLIALLGVLFLLRKTIDSSMVKSKLAVLGVVISGFGVFPLLFTGLLNHMGSFRVLGELVSRPVAEWNMVLGFGLHYLPLLNAIPTTLLALLMLGNSTVKKFAGGFALGTAAICAQTLYSGDMYFFLGSLALKVWMLLNMGVCMYFVRATFSKK